jgi:Na+-driven multidrug efflux pump
MMISLFTIMLNTFLSFGLIFGRFGLPQLGVNGAALAVTIARIVDCLLFIFFSYRRRTAAAASLREMFAYDLPFVKRVLVRSLPVTINEMLWSLGITTYNAVYAHIGTEAIAAVNITSTIENLAFVIFIGLTDATAIMVGNSIGAGEEHRAFDYAWKSLRLSIGVGLLMGLVVLASSRGILSFYKVSDVVSTYASRILLVFSMTLWIRVSNMNIIVGILRAGGDTRVGFLIDVLGIWAVGVPLAFAGAFLFALPVYWVYLMIMTEEAVKMGVGILRVFSGKWITNLAVVPVTES